MYTPRENYTVEGFNPIQPMKAEVNNWKYGSTCSLKQHNFDTADVYRSHTATVMVNRQPAYPANVPDLSAE